MCFWTYLLLAPDTAFCRKINPHPPATVAGCRRLAMKPFAQFVKADTLVETVVEGGPAPGCTVCLRFGGQVLVGKLGLDDGFEGPFVILSRHTASHVRHEASRPTFGSRRFNYISDTCIKRVQARGCDTFRRLPGGSSYITLHTSQAQKGT